MVFSRPEIHFDLFREDASLRDPPPIHSYVKLKVKIGSDARNGNGHPFMDPNQSSVLVRVKVQGTRQIFSEPPLLGRELFHL